MSDLRFQSLKTISITFLLTEDSVSSWQHLLGIFESTPFLEEFYLQIQENFDNKIEPELELNAIKECANKLAQISTLKSLRFSIKARCQETLDVFQGLFGTLKGLKKLAFTTPFCNSSLSFTLPKSLISNIAHLTELRLWHSFSPQSQLQDLITGLALSDSAELQTLQFMNRGDIPVKWLDVQNLMKTVPKLPKLRVFVLDSPMVFDLEDVKNIEDQKKLLNSEIMELIANCQGLEVAAVASAGFIRAKYNKYPL